MNRRPIRTLRELKAIVVRRSVIRCGVLKLSKRDEKCVKSLDSGEDLSCLVLRQMRRALVN
jgi:hypothetical protein